MHLLKIQGQNSAKELNSIESNHAIEKFYLIGYVLMFAFTLVPLHERKLFNYNFKQKFCRLKRNLKAFKL
jgi:hypothetical protein